MNTHTTRARAAAQRDYLAFAKRSNRDDLAAWVNNMRSRGLAANTIRQRVCLVRHWLDRKENVTLPARCNVRERKWLNPEQVQAMLAVIPNNESGRQDFALLTAFLVTGLRLGQVRNWSWSDFRREGRTATAGNKNFPKAIFDVLQAIRSGCRDAHSNNMPLSLAAGGEDYIFTATHHWLRTDQGRRVPSSTSMKKQPLSPQEINRRIRRYARLAGLEPQGISVECLRRTHNELGENTVITLVQNSLLRRNASPVRWKRIERDGRLHGIGRRGGHR